MIIALATRRMRTFVLCCLAGLCLTCPAFAQNSSDKVHVDIPAQSLSSALTQFGRDTGTEIVFTPDAVSQKVSTAIRGDFAKDKAIALMLAGTGLTYRVTSQGAIIVGISTELKTSGIGISDKAARVAQAGTPNSQSTSDNPQNSNVPASESSSPSELEKSKISEIVVTGTHIAGESPVGSPLITVTEADIANSGLTSIGDVIRSLPQSFGGGVNPGTLGTTTAASSQNVSAASTVNLRGLGSDSTLTLVDGHRLAFDGFTSSTDISSIPLSAVERVEVLTDSASAIYGSDAVAGVANFILKKNYEGAQTNVMFGEANGGDAKQYGVDQLLGTNWDGGNAMLAYEHYRQDALYASERSFSDAALAPLTLLPYQSRDSVFGSVRQNLSDSVSTYAELLYSDRKSETVVTTAGPVSDLNATSTTQYTLSSGLTARLGRGWTAGVDGTLSQGKNNNITSTVNSEVTTVSPANYYANRADSIDLNAAGSVVELPSGPLEAAVGTGYRTESYHDNSGDALELRHVDYTYGELRIPVIRDDTTRLGLEKLELSIAGRYEHYSDFGASGKPKFGVSYSATHDLALRATWGKAFRAPDLETEYGQRQMYVYPGAPLGITSPAGAQAILLSGSNPSLQPETARSWTSGFDYTPDWAPGLKAGLTYYNIDYRNRIAQPVTNLRDSATNPLYAPFVLRNPSADVLAALLAQANYFKDFSGVGYDPSKVVAVVNNEYQNAVEEKTHGLDLSGDYNFSEAFGDFDLSLNAAWLSLTEILTPTSPELVLSGTVFNPPKFRARFGLTWSRGPWSAASFVNYVGSETDNTTTPYVDVSSWTTIDARLSYDATSLGGIFRGMRVSASGQNLMNRDPPALRAISTFVGSIGYDGTNASPLGRSLNVTIRKDW